MMPAGCFSYRRTYTHLFAIKTIQKNYSNWLRLFGRLARCCRWWSKRSVCRITRPTFSSTLRQVLTSAQSFELSSDDHVPVWSRVSAASAASTKPETETRMPPRWKCGRQAPRRFAERTEVCPLTSQRQDDVVITSSILVTSSRCDGTSFPDWSNNVMSVTDDVQLRHYTDVTFPWSLARHRNLARNRVAFRVQAKISAYIFVHRLYIGWPKSWTIFRIL